MKTALDKLNATAGPAFSGSLITGLATGHADLKAFLSRKNGFFAFESALRVFPAGDSAVSPGIDDWNSSAGWRKDYGTLANGLLFFAEDIFGVQFCIKDGKFFSFDPETAELTFIGDNLEAWAQAILDDYDLMTGYALAHEWQQKNGALAPFDRLMPRLPFVLGGEFDTVNLMAIDGARSMRCRGNLARQIVTLPEGAKITFSLVA